METVEIASAFRIFSDERVALPVGCRMTGLPWTFDDECVTSLACHLDLSFFPDVDSPLLDKVSERGFAF